MSLPMEANIPMNFRDPESKVFYNNGRILPFKYMNLNTYDFYRLK